MRILHTSDWHLGRTFHGRVLDDAHAAFTEHLLELVRAEKVDAVLVSGDVYDRTVPPQQSVQLLDETLRRLSERTRVVLTPGNHDSAQRLGFASSLLREGLVIQARADGVDRAITLPDSAGRPGALVYALPYLDPESARWSLPPLLSARLGESPGEVPEQQTVPAAPEHSASLAPPASQEPPGSPRLPRSHEAVVSGALRLVAADLARQRQGASRRLPAVVMAHAFVSPTGPGASDAESAQPSESERDIKVGGVDLVPSQVFATLGGSPHAPASGGLDYAALGHLHRPQQVKLPAALRQQVESTGTPLPLLRYSGSPLPFSFSEAPYPKSSVLLELGPKGVTRSELVPTPQTHQVLTLRGSLEELLSPQHDGLEAAWLRVELTGELVHDATARLRRRFPNLLALTRVAPALAAGSVPALHRQADLPQVADAFLAAAGGRAPTPAESAVLREAYEAARNQEGSR
ncbi:exonuclease SbcCD subunit D [Actinomyces weissii]|uniref:Nuclease SbcCD subunit D n=1 Tax=Actinomyces weissii TaxID=675090 RepID=A0A7T7M950_9ACTO|nr:exonuclease SbcCD subunit D C-terminal domain-containing protein [Actinomyces weissii]QQM66964.1 exonuclease subunit SbcD [Actinomyces weissii]